LSEEKKAPIFLLGVERSGTNLLRMILNEHSNIFAPSTPHIISRMYNNEIFYGSLTNDNNFKIFVSDILEIVNSNLGEWKDFNLKVNDVIKNINVNDRSLLSVFKYIYNAETFNNGKTRWFCKGRNLYEYVYDLKEFFQNSVFIHMVRDPRDVCLSFKLKRSPKSLYSASLLWKKEQEICIRLYKNSKFKNTIFLLKYENLLENPKKEIRKLCEFIDEPFEDEMLNFHRGSTSKILSKKSQVWMNLSKPILSNNYKKYKSGLKPKQIQIIEGMNHRIMKYFDYECEFPYEEYKTDGLNYHFNVFKEDLLSLINLKIRKGDYKEEIKRREMNAIDNRTKNRYLSEKYDLNTYQKGE